MNTIPIKSWSGESDDRELHKLIPYMEKLSAAVSLLTSSVFTVSLCKTDSEVPYGHLVIFCLFIASIDVKAGRQSSEIAANYHPNPLSASWFYRAFQLIA